LKKKHCSKPLFSHGRCQHDQDNAFHEGMGDDNRNFSEFSIFGEELERKFQKTPNFFAIFEIWIKDLIITGKSYWNLNYEMFWCTDWDPTQNFGFT